MRRTGDRSLQPPRRLGRDRLRLLLAAVLVLLLGVQFLAMSPASAGADDYPSPWRAPTAINSVTDSWGYFNRQCTSFVAWRLSQRNGFPVPRAMGDAGSWGDWATAHNVGVNMTPAVGAVAWWRPNGTSMTSGHVAWVEAVSGSSVTIEEYNLDYRGNYSRRTISAAAVSGYIHFQDLPSSEAGRGTQLTGDVDGDGRADAVVYFASSGNWYVAASTGRGGQWSAGHGVGSSRQFLADVNGDGRADAVVYFPGSGQWYVAESTGSSFGGYYLWHNGHGAGSQTQLLADVDGDRKADAVVFFSNGDWYVAASTGRGGQWTAGHGAGSSRQFLADVNGDGRADAVVYFPGSGQWYVAESAGSSFGGYYLWRNGHGAGSADQLLADIDGDGKADPVVYFATDGSWYAAPSQGPGGRWTAGHGVGSDRRMLADVNGDGRADAVAFFGGAGDWYVATSTSSAFTGAYRWLTGHGVGSV